VDGLTGFPAEHEESLAADLVETRERFPNLPLLFASRDRGFPRRFGVPTYHLLSLGTTERRTIAAGLVDDAPTIVADLESELGEVVENPLLFVMALALTRVGLPANGRTEIFGGFIKGLCERAKETTVDDADLAALRLVSAALIDNGSFAADRYWWLEALAEALAKLRAGRVYEVGDRTAEAVFRRLQTVGLIFEDEITASVSLLHDAFRDYLTSVALARREVDVPASTTQEWEQAIELAAEQGAVNPNLARTLAKSNVVAATRAGRFDKGHVDAALTGELARTMASRHLGSSPIGSDFGVAVFTSSAHRYGLVVAGGLDAEVAPEEAEALATKASFIVALSVDVGPLALAAAMWRELLREQTAAQLPTLLRPRPTAASELAVAIAEQTRGQRSELKALAERLVPTLADRVVMGVGWTGLRAHVDEPQTRSLLPGQTTTFHPLLYSYGGDEVVVTAAPAKPAGIDFQTQGIAEGFVERPPRDVALKALVKELNQLLPEIR
jgi:hypothetical protein